MSIILLRCIHYLEKQNISILFYHGKKKIDKNASDNDGENECHNEKHDDEDHCGISVKNENKKHYHRTYLPQKGHIRHMLSPLSKTLTPLIQEEERDRLCVSLSSSSSWSWSSLSVLLLYSFSILNRYKLFAFRSLRCSKKCWDKI